jgi:hypothetical protein
MRQEEERSHELIRWCMAMGADPRGVAGRADAMSVGLPPSPPGPGWKVPFLLSFGTFAHVTSSHAFVKVLSSRM